MNPDPFVFAMANPNPEVKPEEAAPYVRVMATGRSDYPNQINNVLAFPGIFRGALDVRATAITEEMKLAAARGIASVVGDDELDEDYIIPSVFNRDVAREVAAAVRRGGRAHRRGRRGRAADGRAGHGQLMRVAVTGATGMIGSALVRALVERGDEVTALSRNAARASEALGVPAETWADPEAERAAARRPARTRRRGAPARRADRPALVGRDQAGDPRLARALHPQPRGRPRGAARRRAPARARVGLRRRLVRAPGRRAARRVAPRSPATTSWRS